MQQRHMSMDLPIIKMLLTLIYCVIISILTSGCQREGKEAMTVEAAKDHQKESVELVVYAAASLTESFESIKSSYEKKHPDVRIIYNFAGSQLLASQIEQGANPSMVFSANESYIDQLLSEELPSYKYQLTEKDKDIFATNQLVALVNHNTGVETFEELMSQLKVNEAITIILAQEDVPVGDYTQKMLEAYEVSTGDVEGRKAFVNHVISYESDVKAVLAKIKMGEADCGIVYSTDCNDLSENLIKLPLGDAYNQVGKYASLNFDQSEEAKAFYNYIIEGEGQAILKDFGFNP